MPTFKNKIPVNDIRIVVKLSCAVIYAVLDDFVFSIEILDETIINMLLINAS